ncbi:fungal-specific transcription factor domain-containing protein [Macrophomina phaseolina]|uniref:Fungal-specific transcription factor domain-containing protein n=1 Tax=Macrophomina phaseolina TaxID=35725 RepID=A0ABQ8GVR3_9PEZI|nr:fungal-specific transcription factor domain-containing protein [Macrophomina phaseolina]
MPLNPQQPKKPVACVRCRNQKVKCDGVVPCGKCVKAGVPCEDGATSERRYILHLEGRVHELEALVSRLQAPSGPSASASSHPPDHYPANSAANSSAHHARTPPTPRIGPDQPLAHEVGLLSLQAANSPKYLGPSSGVSFARLVFASAPHTQGLSTQFSADLPQHQLPDPICATGLPSPRESYRFIGAYLDQFSHLYPFLDELYIDQLVEKCSSKPSTATDTDMCTLYLVIAIGSRSLESQLGSDFASTSYMAAAMKLIANVPLHESIQGVQIMLLLVISSFCFPGSLNAWFLTHTILASCLDLGLQRKQIPDTAGIGSNQRFGGTVTSHDIRSSIFWSAYSLDRTLCTTLGRPLTLRDEALDIEFPGQQGSDEIDLDAIEGAVQCLDSLQAASPTTGEGHRRPHQSKRMRTDNDSLETFYPANWSFRFDRIVAEVKLMIHRVAQSPKRFPWPTDLENWQKTVHSSCQKLLENAKQALSQRAGGIPRTLSYRVLPSLELKYHQCILLLYRPSPAFPRPSLESLSICFDSATETVRIYYELHRFGQMMNSWLTAHTIFVSGITMLYCLWISPSIREKSRDCFEEHSTRCSETLGALGKTWSVAKDAKLKFDRLADATKESWKRREESTALQTGELPGVSGEEQQSRNEDCVTNMGWADQSSNVLFNSTDFIADELGDVSGWFDLEWFETFGVEGLGDSGMV